MTDREVTPYCGRICRNGQASSCPELSVRHAWGLLTEGGEWNVRRRYANLPRSLVANSNYMLHLLLNSQTAPRKNAVRGFRKPILDYSSEMENQMNGHAERRCIMKEERLLRWDAFVKRELVHSSGLWFEAMSTLISRIETFVSLMEIWSCDLRFRSTAQCAPIEQNACRNTGNEKSPVNGSHYYALWFTLLLFHVSGSLWIGGRLKLQPKFSTPGVMNTLHSLARSFINASPLLYFISPSSYLQF